MLYSSLVYVILSSVLNLNFLTQNAKVAFRKVSSIVVESHIEFGHDFALVRNMALKLSLCATLQ